MIKQSTTHIFIQSQRWLIIALIGITSGQLKANISEESLKQCYLEQVRISEENRLVSEIQTLCLEQLKNNPDDSKLNLTPLERRILREKANKDNPNVITSHKRNYLIPFSYVNQPNNLPYVNANPEANNSLDNFEAKFQLSFKAPIRESILKKDDMLFFGFTLQSFWQMYNSELSSPFRETNYQPEIFYGVFNDFKIGQWTNRVNVIGIEHQSNGRTQPLSRSWNRTYAEFVWENDNWLISFKPWYRLEEKTKLDPNLPEGDDNPDINFYMGNFEFSTVYKWDSQTFGAMFRNNLKSDNRGAIQLDWTFPMGWRFKGYAQYFSGYGESLIDYNESIQRIGIGVLITDVF
jgi:phospholipase A1/A2